MDKISKLYYINLDRKHERNKHILQQCFSANIPSNKIQRFPAFDGDSHPFTDEELAMFSNCDFKPYTFFKRIVGNQLSHYNILLDMINNKYEYVIICQDDVMFRDDFIKELEFVMTNMPSDAEIINIGMHKKAVYYSFVPWDFNQRIEDTKFVKNIVNDGICMLTVESNPCSLAYIVTAAGAINLIMHFQMNGFLRATDCNYNDYLINKNIFYASRTVLCTGNNKFPSDIFI
jgi:GR25 family glycosyltransferase involved in LPS biosynthesis